MAVKPLARLPPPPADLAARELPLTRIRGPLYRIHRINVSALFFGRTGRSRFDDPQKRYGVLYAALSPEAAFSEVFLRQLDQLLIEETAVAERALSEILLTPFRCVNLTGPGLRWLSCDNRIADELPYRTSGLWSRALHQHPQKPAGILYRSRHNPQTICVAIFSNVRKQLRVGKTRRLLDSALRAWTGKQLTRYHLELLPSEPITS